MRSLTEAQWQVLRKVILSDAVQYLIGAQKWDLTEAEEDALWDIIKIAGEGKTS